MLDEHEPQPDPNFGYFFTINPETRGGIPLIFLIPEPDFCYPTTSLLRSKKNQ